MSMWITPLIFVTLVSLAITLYAIRKSSGFESLAKARDEIAEPIEEHPFALNPILWIILMATIFIGIVIVYYATQYST